MKIKVGSKTIGDNCPVFIVAELGINHNGKLSLAKKMIKAAKKAGVDAVKLQSFVTEDFVGDKDLMYTYKSQGKTVTESQYAMFKRVEIGKNVQAELFKFARQLGLIVFSTPQDNSFRTVDYLCAKLKMPAIKVGSDDLTNLSMLAHYARKRKPVIISTGMANLGEVKEAVREIKKQGNKKIIILKCTSLYPTPPQQANLSQIETLRRAFKDCLIGFSDHTRGTTAAVMAVALSAAMVEKHFTLDHNLPGPDHWFSADPAELTTLVNEIRRAEKSLGNPKLVLSKAEERMKTIARRSIIAAREIKKGHIIKADDLACKRPGTGLAPKYLTSLIGKMATRNFRKGRIFVNKDL